MPTMTLVFSWSPKISLGSYNQLVSLPCQSQSSSSPSLPTAHLQSGSQSLFCFISTYPATVSQCLWRHPVMRMNSTLSRFYTSWKLGTFWIWSWAWFQSKSSWIPLSVTKMHLSQPKAFSSWITQKSSALLFCWYQMLTLRPWPQGKPVP